MPSGLSDEYDAAKRIVNAAIEMQDYVARMLESPSQSIVLPFSMRLGIHIGPVVAGVVGVNKFQYDIWGNSVNIASRIESTSLPGRVTISDILFNVLESHREFIFEKREVIIVKNIGPIQTYFV